MAIPKDILRDWGFLNKHVMNLTEKELSEIFEREKNGKQRLSLLLRIQARLNKLQTRRQRLAVLENHKKEA